MTPTIEKIKENNKRKLEHRINTFISLTGYTKVETFDSTISDYLTVHKFIDNQNQIKFLSGYEFNNASSLKNWYVQNYNNFNVGEKLGTLMKFSNYDFSELVEKDYKDIDHNISPICPEHGEFITTPRKLIQGDKCKWCDGIENNEGDLSYSLDRGNRINEKLFLVGLYNNLKVLKYDNPYVIHIEFLNPEGKTNYTIVTLKYFQDAFKLYQNQISSYLKSIREQSHPVSIFYKINFIDKSTKFQFGIVDYISTNISIDELDDTKIEELIREKYSKTKVYFNMDISFYSVETEIRAYLKTIQYKQYNESKSIILPEDILNKFPKENFSGFMMFSENTWESTSTSVRLIRESFLKKSCICPICNKEIVSPVLDHQHKKKVRGTGRIRNNICSNCNVFIAKTENNCTRFKIAQEELPEVLKNISEYFGAQQYNIIHYTDKESRPTLSKTIANKVLKYWEYLYPGKKKLLYPKSGVLTKDWEDALKKLQEFQNSSQQSFNKNDYKLFVKKIEDYNNEIETKNLSLSKTKKLKPIKIPEYPKQKMITPEIQKIMEILK
mgnify:CR=1 FL=1